ncbi:hypothetical protein KC19_VG311000 [Ceratodon purpureus]|uniref:Uncharacterized protein n=1 Tax=Ceratodon purpureus TaxID=3225 RepID=A0A8T0HVG6_CERPU|nr:hypothetical protein KC19_VG311000 [Ceratodon purpureus]
MLKQNYLIATHTILLCLYATPFQPHPPCLYESPQHSPLTLIQFKKNFICKL